MHTRSRLAGAALAAAIGLVLAVDLPARATGPVQLAEAAPGSLAGTWKGNYRYSDKRLPPKAFTAAIEASKAGKFAGRVTEPRYTRMGAAGLMSANINGSVGKDRKVRFIKRYTGISGFGNPVRYEGTLGPKGRTIKGTWSIPEEKLKGTFVMTRTGGAPSH